jgi:hypothetical protein
LLQENEAGKMRAAAGSAVLRTVLFFSSTMFFRIFRCLLTHRGRGFSTFGVRSAGFKEECFYPPGAEEKREATGLPCGNPIAAV